MKRFFLGFCVVMFLCLVAHYASAAGHTPIVILNANINPLDEIRYCGPPKRDAKGTIIRRADVLAAFRKLHPCPSTGLTKGACPGWAMNHDRSLACGGCDAVWNLSWMPADIKSCAGPHCVDRYERYINQIADPVIADTAECVNKIVP